MSNQAETTMRKNLFSLIIIFLFSLNLFAETPDYGDSIATAEELTMFSYKDGMISPNDDEDYFQFTLTSQTTVYIETSNQYGKDNMDTYLYLYNSSGTILNEDDDSGNNYFSRIIATLNAGTYYVKVQSYTKASSGDYKLSLSKYVNYDSNNPRAFTMQQQDNIRGNIVMVGNSVLQSSSGACLSSTTQNNDINAYYADKDDDSSTYNSTSADLVLPKGIKKDNIVYALLYWQGRVYSNLYAGTYGRTVKLKLFGSSSYETVISSDEKFNYIYGDYQGVVDITDKLKASMDNLGDVTLDSSGYNQPVWVADVYTDQGSNKYGAWSLIVTYRDANDELKNITLYDGYDEIHNGESNGYTLTNFLTPTNGEVNAKFMVFAGEGDVVYSDSISLTDKNGNDISLGNDFFRSSENIDGVNITNRNPNCENTIGIDLQTVSVGTNATIPVIGNGQTQTTVTLSSGGDQYFPGVFAFATQLYEPRVCYYIDTIKDDNNNTIFENKKFINDIEANKNYHFNLWISNMKKLPTDIDIENAKLVQIYVQMKNGFDYKEQSTWMQNIGETSFINLTDAIGDDLGEFESDSNKSTWRVGVGATSTQGGLLEVASDFNDDSKKSFIKLEGLFNIDTNTTNFDLSDHYEFRASFQTDTITIGADNAQLIEQCVELNTTGVIYTPQLGSFNVINSNYTSGTVPLDVNDSTNALYTQITKKDFNVKVVKLSSDFQTPEKYSGLVQIDLINNPLTESDCTNNNPLITQSIIFSNTSLVEPTINYSRVNNDARFRIKYLVDNNGNIIDNSACTSKTNNCVWGLLTQIASVQYGNSCPTGTTFVNDDNLYCDVQCAVECNYYRNSTQGADDVPDEACLQCLFGTYSNSVCSRDNFAIRPDKFDLNISSASPYIAGKDYNISFLALDGNTTTSLPSLDYNETVDVSFSIDINETKAGCITGDFNNSLTNVWSFGDGNKTILSAYDEVGVVNIKIEEISGSEFALVDLKDTNDSLRYITPYDKNISYLPDHFDINASLKQQDNNFTYISNDLNMSLTLDINITAMTEDNKTIENYNSSCYATATDYNISYEDLNASLLTGITNLNYRDRNDSDPTDILESNQSAINSNISLTLPNGVFSTDHNGTARLHFDINFDRNITTPINPFKMVIKDINITDQNDTNGTTFLNKSALFYYGRVHAPDQRFDNINGIAQVYYEVYCDDCNKTDFNVTGSESIDSINWFTNTLHVNNDGNVSTFTPVGTMIAPIPANIVNGVESVPLAAPKTPYKDKIDMTSSSWLIYNPTDFMVEFYGTGNWAGQGIQGKTVDLNISRRQNKRLDW